MKIDGARLVENADPRRFEAITELEIFVSVAGEALVETPDAVEIGSTWLAPSAQRTAINTHAKLLMLTHAFEAWAVLRVTLKTDARNLRSRAAIERIGARFDGVLRAHMPAFDGGVRDTAFYSIVAVEWPELRRALLDRVLRTA